MNKDDMGGTCSLKGRNDLGDICVDGRIILKRISGKCHETEDWIKLAQDKTNGGLL
jgi:hypothetical protein